LTTKISASDATRNTVIISGVVQTNESFSSGCHKNPQHQGNELILVQRVNIFQ
jgi:hypothetical protein